MKHSIKVIGFLLFLLIVQASCNNVKKQSRENLYPKKYTFQKAEKFQTEGKINEAMWFYINLYPKNPNKVIQKVKALKVSIDSQSLEELVKRSFKRYASSDPEIHPNKNDTTIINKTKLDSKSQWAGRILLKTVGEPEEQ